MGGEISFYFELWHAITVSGFISSQTMIIIAGTRAGWISATRCWENSDPAIAGHFGRHDRVRSTATSRILLPMKLRHSAVREEVHWPSRRSPASGGLRGRRCVPRKSRSNARSLHHCAHSSKAAGCPRKCASASPAKCNEPVIKIGAVRARALSIASTTDEVMECWSAGIIFENILASIFGSAARELRIFGNKM